MNKNQLRLHYKEKRDSLCSEHVSDFSICIANLALEIPIWNNTFYHIFLSIFKNKEVDTQPLLSILHGKDKNVVLSKTFPKRSLKNYLLTDSTIIKENRLGIPEPEGGIEIKEDRLDVVFVPLLAFDSYGHRVGYGGGYYDVLLSKCRKDTLKIGLSFFEAESNIDNIDEHDIRLDYCITPTKVYEF